MCAPRSCRVCDGQGHIEWLAILTPLPQSGYTAASCSFVKGTSAAADAEYFGGCGTAPSLATSLPTTVCDIVPSGARPDHSFCAFVSYSRRLGGQGLALAAWIPCLRLLETAAFTHPASPCSFFHFELSANAPTPNHSPHARIPPTPACTPSGTSANCLPMANKYNDADGFVVYGPSLCNTAAGSGQVTVYGGDWWVRVSVGLWVCLWLRCGPPWPHPHGSGTLHPRAMGCSQLAS